MLVVGLLQLPWFQALEENFGSLARKNRELIAKAEAIDAQQRIVLDMDSPEIPVYASRRRVCGRQRKDGSSRFWTLRAAREPRRAGSETAPGRRMRLGEQWMALWLILNES